VGGVGETKKLVCGGRERKMESKGDAKWDGKYRKWGQVDILKSQLATEFAPSKNNESADV